MDVSAVVLHLSERDNVWNKQVLAMARKEREERWDRMIELSRKTIGKINKGDINGLDFNLFYDSRKAGIVARNRWECYVKSFVVEIMKPYYGYVYNSLIRKL